MAADHRPARTPPLAGAASRHRAAARHRGRRWPGAAASAAGLALVALAVIEGQDQGWTSALVLAAFAAGAGILTAFVLAERRRASPLVDVSLFLRPAFAAANFAALIVFFAFVGAIVYFSAYFQQVQGRSPVASGIALIATALVISPLLIHSRAATFRP